MMCLPIIMNDNRIIIVISSWLLSIQQSIVRAYVPYEANLRGEGVESFVGCGLSVLTKFRGRNYYTTIIPLFKKTPNYSHYSNSLTSLHKVE